tara:strand:- start:213 stop:389 length:177 start_codon:yes stop_codon:yes gene_type:complete
MIKIVKNENFPKWIQIFAFNKCVEEVDSKRTALRIAKKLAHEHDIKCVCAFGKFVFTD